MPLIASLNQNHEFRRIYHKGKSRVHPLLVTYALRNRSGAARMGVVSSKKIGNAVVRNRARRVVRAAFRESGMRIPPGWDIIFVCRTKTAYKKSTQVTPVMCRQLHELLAKNSAREQADHK